MKAAIVTVGDEILIGQIVDTNSAWISSQLAQIGVEVTTKISVADDRGSILKGIKRGFEDADLLLMTGGLGPTKDDITKSVLVEYFGGGMQFSQATFDQVRQMFEKRGITMTESHKAQFYMPEFAEILENRMGTAPGMWFRKGRKTLCAMPGVPHEMKFIVSTGVLPRIQSAVKTVFLQKTLRTSGVGESMLAEMIEPILKDHPVKLAYLPSQGQVRLRLSIAGEAKAEQTISQVLRKAVDATIAVLGTRIYGYDEDTLEEHIGELLKERGLTLGTAESCTGGYVGHMITSVPGASTYFKGSIVSYDNSVKEELLGVKTATLMGHGAVSQETVEEMVSGAIRSLRCDVAIAISGICGPSGGSVEKPVGTVWIAVGNQDCVESKRFLFSKNRILNIQYAGVSALHLLRKFLSAR
ncbi:UNVERIFIED_CONTAM: hypothetical protein GTU68_045524 [Idotea baltica]|nr:hypothetical protein [Idotea baltica]